MIKKHFEKNNLHHAYLIEGQKEPVLMEVLGILNNMGIKCIGNPDLYRINMDNLKIDDALYLREMASKKSFNGGKKFFLISVNSITREAEGVMLKMFEEPGIDTHFFLIIPDASALISTLRSRFYFITSDFENPLMCEAREFIKMSKINRINFLKKFLNEDDKEKDIDSVRAKAERFLNALEVILHENMKVSNVSFFYHIFKIRGYLRQPGSSVKNLLESLALLIPVL